MAGQVEYKVGSVVRGTVVVPYDPSVDAAKCEVLKKSTYVVGDLQGTRGPQSLVVAVLL